MKKLVRGSKEKRESASHSPFLYDIVPLIMKVILLQDVAKIGRKNSVVDVPAGYAQNQLIPKGWAKLATPENLKSIKNLQSIRAASDERAEGRFFEIKKKLEGETLTISDLKSDKGHLFAAVKVEKIIETAKTVGIQIPPSMISIDTPIKSTGEHEITLKEGKHRVPIIIKIA